MPRHALFGRGEAESIGPIARSRLSLLLRIGHPAAQAAVCAVLMPDMGDHARSSETEPRKAVSGLWLLPWHWCGLGLGRFEVEMDVHGFVG